MNNIIGIDPAARKLAMWFSSMKGAQPVPVFTKLPMDDAEACGMAFRTFSEKLAAEQELWTGLKQAPRFIVYMEKSISRGNPHASLVQAHGVGALLAAASEYRAEVHRVDNMTWKKALIGNGRAEKDEIAEYATKRDPHLVELCDGNQDLIDALCIYWYGHQNYPLIEKARKLHAKAEAKKQARKQAAREQRRHQDRAGAGR